MRSARGARAREDPPAGVAADGEDRAPAERPAAAGVRSRLAAGLAGTLASGVSPLAAQLPPITGRWAAHRHAAEFYSSVPMRWLRYGFGFVDAFIETPPIYLWSWTGKSPPLRAAFIVFVVTLLWLFRVI